VQQAAIAALQEALQHAQATEPSSPTHPGHSVRHQGDLATLLAACKLLGIAFPGLAGLPGPSEEISEKDLRTLRTDLAAREVDLKMVRGMIGMLNEQAAQFTNDLNKASERIAELEANDTDSLQQRLDDSTQINLAYRGQIADLKLALAEAKLGQVNAMADLPAARAFLPQTLGRSRVEHLSLLHDVTSIAELSEADDELDEILNSDPGCRIIYTVVLPSTKPKVSYERYILLEREEADEPEEDGEDKAKAADAAPIPAPVSQPVISHAIIINSNALVPDYLREAFSNAKAGWDWEDTGRALMPAVTRFVTGVESPEAEHLAKWSDFYKQLPSWASKSSKQPELTPESTEEIPQTDPLPAPDEFPITNTILRFGKEAVKDALNQMGANAGAQAGGANMNADLALAEALLLAPREKAVDRDPLDYEDGTDLF
jgi:hypothetical protein